MSEIPIISSRDNQRLVNARKIRDRHETGKIFIEGKRLAVEAVRSGIVVHECFVSDRFLATRENSEFVRDLALGARFVFELPDRIFKTIAATDNSQGIILIAERPENAAAAIEQRLRAGKGVPVIVALYQINNPANLGAVLRSAEAVGAAGVIVTNGSADAYSPKAVRASMGAAFRLPVWQGIAFDAAVKWASGLGLIPTATTAGSSSEYTAVNWREPRLLFFGSEAHGLAESELSHVEARVRIPMESPVESLNLAVAAGIILYEARRQNQAD